MGEGVAVSRVVIYNRNDGDASPALEAEESGRLSNSVVSLLNYQGNTLKTYRIGDATNVPVFDISVASFAIPTASPTGPSSPTSMSPTTARPSTTPTTLAPSSMSPATARPNTTPTTSAPTSMSPTTARPSTSTPTAMATASPSENAVLVHKVRVQLIGRNYLHMREVQVFDTSGVNRALNKSATQSSPFYWGEIRSGWNSKCLEYDGNNHLVFMWDCHGGSNQQWYSSSNSKVDMRIQAAGNRCLDAPGGAYYRVYWHWCHDGNNQKWTNDDMGRLHSVAYPHLCLDLYANDNNNGAAVVLYQCNNYMNQQWLSASTTLDASKAVNGDFNDWSHTNNDAGNVP